MRESITSGENGTAVNLAVTVELYVDSIGLAFVIVVVKLGS